MSKEQQKSIFRVVQEIRCVVKWSTVLTPKGAAKIASTKARQRLVIK